jgi:hypothetical protein
MVTPLRGSIASSFRFNCVLHVGWWDVCKYDGTSWVNVCASSMLEHAINEVVIVLICNAAYAATCVLTVSAGLIRMARLPVPRTDRPMRPITAGLCLWHCCAIHMSASHFPRVRALSRLVEHEQRRVARLICQNEYKQTDQQNTWRSPLIDRRHGCVVDIHGVGTVVAQERHTRPEGTWRKKNMKTNTDSPTGRTSMTKTISKKGNRRCKYVTN